MFGFIFRKPLVHILLIVALGLIIYSNTFNAPFQWDEEFFIKENPVVKDLNYFLRPASAKGLALYDAFRNRYVGYLTFALNYRLHGLDVRGYHIFNVAVHITTALLVYFLVSLTFRTPFLNGSSLKGQSGIVSLFTALLFVSHPIQTEAVTYIFQRLASLAAFFYLLSMVLYVKWRLTPPLSSPLTLRGDRRGLLLYVLSLLCSVLAMKTKENAFTLPIAVTLYEFFFFSGPKRKRLLTLAPFLLTMLIIPLSIVGIAKPVGEIIGGIGGASRGNPEISRGDYLLTQFRVIVTYMRLLAFPVNQNADYDYPVFRSFFDAEVLFSFILISMALGSGLLLLRRSRRSAALKFCAFGVFWFFITLSVESGIIPIPMVINEYRVYLPSIGAFILVVGGASILSGKLKRYARTTLVSFLTAAVLIFAFATHARNSVWISRVSLWTDVVKKAPNNPRGYQNLGEAYRALGLIDNAIANYAKALNLQEDALTHDSLGRLCLSKGMNVEAIGHFNAAVKLTPDYYSAYHGLGLAYSNLGSIPEAMASYRKALSLNPAFASAHYNLGILYIESKLFAMARSEFMAYLNIKPDDVRALQFLDYIDKYHPE